MMPNIDPRAMRNIMSKMGIKSSELLARRVVIEGVGKDIIIEDPQVTVIEAQGVMSFQISGKIREIGHAAPASEISDDDVKLVAEKSGKDEASARKALEESEGDIAAAILRLGGQG
jgi:nascent polypeptide-associated complex subunit alpha